MTRENKLALIVGFSVILVVGVLVSDHFSKARQAQLRDLNEQEIGAVGVSRAREFSPTEPLVSTVTTPIAAPSQRSERWQSNTPWSAPRSTGPGLLGNALQANRTSRQPEPRSTTTEQRTVASRGSLRDSPLLIEQGRPNPTGGAIAANTQRTNARDLIETARAHGVNLLPLTQPTSIVTNTTRRAVTPPDEPGAKPWEYHVRKNDSLYSIAEKQLGSGRKWRQIRDLNADRLPNDAVLRIGLRLRMPHEAKRPTSIDATPRPITQAKLKAEPKRKASEYTVQSGDTLGGISQRLLGTVKRMDEIIKLNKDKISNADEIREGMTLRIPAS